MFKYYFYLVITYVVLSPSAIMKHQYIFNLITPYIKNHFFDWSISGVIKTKFHDYQGARVNLQLFWYLRGICQKNASFTLCRGVFPFLNLPF